MKSIVFVTTLLLTSSTSYARVPEPEKTDLGPAPVELEKGEAAPFAGTLFTKERSLLMGKRINNAQRNTAMAIDKVTRLMQVAIDKAERDLAIEKELAEDRERLMQNRLDEVQRWYTQPVFVAAGAVALTVLSIYVARETIIEVH